MTIALLAGAAVAATIASICLAAAAAFRALPYPIPEDAGR